MESKLIYPASDPQANPVINSSNTDLRAAFPHLLNFSLEKFNFQTGVSNVLLRVSILVIQDFALLYLARQLVDGLFNYPNALLLQNLILTEKIVDFVPIGVLFISILALSGLYGSGTQQRNYSGIAKSLAITEGIILVDYIVHSSLTLQVYASLGTEIATLALGILLIVTGRWITHLLVKAIRDQSGIYYHTFLICNPEDCERIKELIQEEECYKILGSIDVSGLDRNNREKTFEKMRTLGVKQAFVSWDAIEKRLFLCWHFRKAGITLHILPTNLQPLFSKPEVWVFRGLPTLRFGSTPMAGLNFWLKRCFDFCSALFLLLVLSPLLIGIAVLIKLDSHGSILYKQTRVGLQGQHFKVWKFRTMVENAEQMQKELEVKNEVKDGILFKIKEDPRVTRIGKVLRQYSLDELPQIFNVLMGNMSLVGPRPLSLRDAGKLKESHLIRQEVLPGITGLWQVSGRSDLTDFDQVARLDIGYIENWSFWLDLKILLKTVQVVLNRTGAY
jgi:exopolysaccharide biosynthesis polyprenyl glycosylphosphotransferase